MNLSSNAFTKDPDAARKAADGGPVFITEHGQPTHVMLNMADYQRLLGQSAKISELLSMSGLVGIDWSPRKSRLTTRPTDLT